MKNDIEKWMKGDGEKFLEEIGIKKGQIVLDFGCGRGYYTIPASRVVDRDGRVYALDKDMSSLNELKKLVKQSNINNVEVINQNTIITLKDNSVDAVLCYDVIHYGSEKERDIIYGEVHRVLTKTGLFSVYPKHHKEDYPLMELANIGLGKVVGEIEKAGFILEHKFSKRLLHDEHYNEGYILNFRRC